MYNMNFLASEKCNIRSAYIKAAYFINVSTQLKHISLVNIMIIEMA